MLDPRGDRSRGECCALSAYISLGISYIKRPLEKYCTPCKPISRIANNEPNRIETDERNAAYALYFIPFLLVSSYSRRTCINSKSQCIETFFHQFKSHVSIGRIFPKIVKLTWVLFKIEQFPEIIAMIVYYLVIFSSEHCCIALRYAIYYMGGEFNFYKYFFIEVKGTTGLFISSRGRRYA